MSGLVFLVFSLFFGFFVDVVFAFVFLFKRQSSGSNRTPPHALVCCSCFFFCPAVGLSSILAVCLASWRFLGVPFWAPCVFRILLVLPRPSVNPVFRGC